MLIPVSFQEQVVPGSFEYALNHIIDNHMDLSVFDERYDNDETGAPAFDPAIMLKIILYAYSLGITSSRQIETLCRTNIVFMALSADSRPHFTTIAAFISEIRNEVESLFTDVLSICASEGLIGKNMFAIDGCKLSSDASKEWSGTRADFERKRKKIEKSVAFLIEKHQAQDKQDPTAISMVEKEKKAIKNLTAKAEKIRAWLDDNDDRLGTSGKPIQSNITDNESAKLSSSEHGQMQGYSGIAAVDEKHQVVVHAEAHGTGSEQQSLESMVDGIANRFEAIEEEDVLKDAVITADTGFHSEANLEMLAGKEVTAYIADKKFRQRDPTFDGAQAHKEKPVGRHHTRKGKRYFTPEDFTYDETVRKMMCPAGNPMYIENRNFFDKHGNKGITYKARKRDCTGCHLRSKCMRCDTTPSRAMTVFSNTITKRKDSFTSTMIKRFDSAIGRHYYSRRMGAVEPVFGNIRHNIGLDHFSHRGRDKVDAQWKLFCMVHNMKKLFRFSPQYA
jgi:transposase